MSGIKSDGVRLIVLLVSSIALLMLSPAASVAWGGNIFDDDWTPPKPISPAAPTARTDVGGRAGGPRGSAPAPTTVPGPIVAPPGLPAVAVPQMPGAVRLSLPAKADQAKSRQLMKQVFAKELADRTPAGRKALARKLMSTAAQGAQSAADEYVLLAGAIAAAKEAADLPTCFEAADTMARRYDVDAAAIKAASALAAPLGPADAADAAEAAQNVWAGLALVGQLEAADDFATAARVAAALQKGATGPSLRAQVRKAASALEAMRIAHDRLGPALEKLKASPGDPSANLAVGRYLCFLKGQWGRGLPMLAKGSDPATASAARKDLGQPAGADARADVGDAWWRLSEIQTGPARAGAQRRAVFWYRKALPDLSGLKRAALEKRVAEAAAAGALAEAMPPATVFRFTHELFPFCYALNDATIPDELTVTQTPDGLRIAGTKRSDAATVHGVLAGHFGKAVLFTARSGSGTLQVGVASEKDHTSYYLLTQDQDGTVRRENPATLQPGTSYAWDVSEQGGRIVLEVSDKGSVMKSVSTPAAAFRAFSFAAEVRYPGEQADLEVRFEPQDAP